MVDAKNKKLAADFKAALDHLTEQATSEATDAAKKLTDQVNALSDSFDPVGVAIRKAQDDLAALNAVTSNGTTHLDKYGAALQRTKEKLDLLTVKAVDQSVFAKLDVARDLFDVKMLPPANETGVTWGKQFSESASGEINKGFEQAVGKGLHDAATGFLSEMESGLTDGLSGPLKSFADALLQAANEWLVEMLANIAKATVAAHAIKGDSSGENGGNSWLSSLQTAWKAYKGSGNTGGGAGVSWAGARSQRPGIAYGHRRDKTAYAREQFVTQAKVDPATGRLDFTRAVSGMSGQATEALRALFTSLQDTIGASIKTMDAVTIMADHDGKEFVVKMGALALGRFKSMDEAIAAAFQAAIKTATFDKNLAPAVQQVIANAGSFADPQAFQDAIKFVQDLVDSSAGLSDIEKQINSLPNSSQNLADKLMALGVSMSEAAKLANDAQNTNLNAIRDQITGHQASIAEQRKQKEAEAALFNAKVILIRAELEAERQSILARLEMLRAWVATGSPPPGAGPHGPQERNPEGPGIQIDRPDMNGGGGISVHNDNTPGGAATTQASIVGTAYRAQIEYTNAWAQATTKITSVALGNQVQMTGAAANASAAAISEAEKRLAEIDKAIADLPKLIDFKEIHIGGMLVAVAIRRRDRLASADAHGGRGDPRSPEAHRHRGPVALHRGPEGLGGKGRGGPAPGALRSRWTFRDSGDGAAPGRDPGLSPALPVHLRDGRRIRGRGFEAGPVPLADPPLAWHRPDRGHAAGQGER